jgi:hypothetical protein
MDARIALCGWCYDGTTPVRLIDFKDEDGDEATPTAATYAVRDVLTGTELVVATTMTVTTPTYALTLPLAATAVVDADRGVELRLVDVQYTVNGRAQRLPFLIEVVHV